MFYISILKETYEMVSNIVAFFMEMALVNGLIAYNLQYSTKKLTQKKFREKVIHSLLCNHSFTSKSGKRSNSDQTNNRLTQRHFLLKLEGTKQNNCMVCSNLTNCKGKVKINVAEKRTSYFAKNV